MNAVVSICLASLCAGRHRVPALPAGEQPAAASTAPPACPSSAPTLPLDECFDRLDVLQRHRRVFAYECRRENDGGFLLHLTLHQPTQQPLDTLYTLRLDPGRQTVVTLIFIREAFGYKEPLFPPAMLDEFMLQKLDAHRTK